MQPNRKTCSSRGSPARQFSRSDVANTHPTKILRVIREHPIVILYRLCKFRNRGQRGWAVRAELGRSQWPVPMRASKRGSLVSELSRESKNMPEINLFSTTIQNVTISVTSITANQISLNYHSPNGNSPGSFGNALYIWQSGDQIPWQTDAQSSQAVTTSTPDGSTSFT